MSTSDGFDHRAVKSNGADPNSSFVTSCGDERKNPNGNVSIADVNATTSVYPYRESSAAATCCVVSRERSHDFLARPPLLLLAAAAAAAGLAGASSSSARRLRSVRTRRTSEAVAWTKAAPSSPQKAPRKPKAKISPL